MDVFCCQLLNTRSLEHNLGDGFIIGGARGHQAHHSARTAEQAAAASQGRPLVTPRAGALVVLNPAVLNNGLLLTERCFLVSGLLVDLALGG